MKVIYIELTEHEAMTLKDFLMENTTENDEILEAVYKKLKKELDNA